MTRRHRAEVRVEVEQVAPPLGVGQVRAPVRGGDEHDLVDDSLPARLGQNLFDEGPRRQSTAAVGDDVDGDSGGGRVLRQPLEQVGRVLSGVEAEGLVVVADHGVVGVHGIGEKDLARHREREGAEAADGRAERAVHEEQDAGRPVGRQVQLVEGLEGLPLAQLLALEVHEARADLLLQLVDDLAEHRGRHEPEDDGLHRALDEVAEQPSVAAARAGIHARRRLARSRGAGRPHVDLEGRRARFQATGAGAVHRVGGQVPGVHAVAFEQHDRVLARRDVDLEGDRAATTGARGRIDAVEPPVGAWREVDPVEHHEVVVTQHGQQRVFAHGCLVARLTRQPALTDVGSRRRVVVRGRAYAEGSAGKRRVRHP